MKKIILTLVLSAQLLGGLFAQLANNQQTSKRKIQVAILLDTSGSMNGLLSQAQSKLWSIVNSLALFQFNGETPTFELALYHYGNSRLKATSKYVECLIPLTTDLDAVSEKLFSLYIDGGEEYCGSVINDALDNLKWSKDEQDMKLIYIAGNERFNQGPDNYKDVLKKACKMDVIVNTIYCGNYEQGVRELWEDGANICQGKYFNIDHNNAVRYVSTPYDDSISILNTQLNGTYMAFGVEGKMKKESQARQDNLAGAVAEENLVERAVAKSSAAYINDTWDLVDYSLSNAKGLKDIKDADLPEELKGKTLEEKEKILNEKREERVRIQAEIALLARKRDAHIQKELAGSEGEDDFGKAVARSLIELGARKNYSN